MRFRFCGDLDAPDWLYPQIASLSKITEVRLKLFATEVAESLARGSDVNHAKIQKLAKGLGSTDAIKGAVSAIQYVMSGAAKHDITGMVLAVELNQLGLQEASSKGVAQTYEAQKPGIRRALRASSFHLPRLESAEWRVDYVLDSSSMRNVDTPAVQLKLNLSHRITESQDQHSAELHSMPEVVAFDVSAQKFKVLHNELKQAYATMCTLD